jgi:hypothetical protein
VSAYWPYPATPIIRGAQWRFIVTDLDGSTIMFMDRQASDRVVVARLNAPWEASLNVSSENPEVNIVHTDGYPFLHEGNRLLYGLRREELGGTIWVCRFAGVIMSVTDDTGSDTAQTTVTAYDPWKFAYTQPALKTDDIFGTIRTYPDSEGINYNARPGSYIAPHVLAASPEMTRFVDAGVSWLGTGFYAGTIETTENIGYGDEWNQQQGSSVGDVWDAVVDTGTADIVLTPIYDPVNRPGMLAEMNVYTFAGDDVPEAVMAWDRAGRSLSGMNRQLDGSRRANHVRTYYGQGGELDIDVEDATSVSTFGEYVSQQWFPGMPKQGQVVHQAWKTLALRAYGQRTISVDPVAEGAPLALLEYTVGDRVPVYASANFREEMADVGAALPYHRVYEIPIVIDDEGTERAQGVVVSTDYTAELVT